MPRKSSDFEFRQQATMSQRLGFLQSDFQELAGADPATSKKIQRLKVCIRHNIVNEADVKICLDFLNGDRMALFATSENTNEISKLGFMLPSKETVYSGEE